MHDTRLEKLTRAGAALTILTGLAALALTLGTTHASHAQGDGAKGEGDKKMAAAIDAALAAPALQGARVGVHVVDAKTGEEIYAREADGAFNPASNQKLLTGACALDVLGPQHTFKTRVAASGVSGSTAANLYVVGGAEGLLFERHLLEWAAEIRAQGITEVSGDIVVVEDAFSGEDLPPGFEQKLEPGAYRSPVGALSVNLNAATVTVRATELGKPAGVRIDPPNAYVEVVNEATTVPGRYPRLSVNSAFLGGRTVITVKGKIGANSAPFSIARRIDDPARFAGESFAAALASVGVKVSGEVKRGEAPGGARDLVTHTSEPLSYLTLTMNKHSSNFIAELLLRTLGTTEAAGGERGTWAGGVAVLRDCAKRLGVPKLESLKIMNGSGLYTGNTVSPRQLTALLRGMSTHRWSHEFIGSLPIGGVDGSLTRRFGGDAMGRVRAKTGTLNEVTALSGYARTRSGRDVAFSILLNDTPTRAWRLRPQQDAIAEAIALSE